MKKLLKTITMIAGLAAALNVQAASKHDYTYAPAAGVHEVKHFHGCFDSEDQGPRPKINVTMNGLAIGDVYLETRTLEKGKPSTEMFTLRLKNMNASLTVQFRSNDGGHCQQGVQSITFTDAVLRNAGDLNRLR